MDKRVATAALGIPLLLVLVWLGGWVWTAAVALIVLFMLNEFLALVRRLAAEPSRGLLAVALLLAAVLTHAAPWGWSYLGTGVVMVVLAAYLSGYPRLHFRDAAFTLAGFSYLVLPVYLIALRDRPEGATLVLALLLLTWASDSGAYFSGLLFGRHHLAPRLSPKKTWEGLAGGLLLALIAGGLVCFWIGGPWWFWLVQVLVVVGGGLLGDLLESALKREAGVKDAGTLLPGHGGFLDRFDSLTMAAPLFYHTVLLLF